MAFTKEIVSKTFSGETGNYLELRNGYYIREIADSWNHLLFGVRLRVNSIAFDSVANKWRIGLCAGVGPFQRPGATHNICVHFGGSSAFFSGSGATSYVEIGTPSFHKQVDASFPIGVAVSGDSSAYGRDTALPGIIILEVTKGSPNWNFKLYASGSAAPNKTIADFAAAMADPTTLPQRPYGSSGTDQAVDEATDGALDHVWVHGYNDGGLTLDIADVAVKVIS